MLARMRLADASLRLRSVMSRMLRRDQRPFGVSKRAQADLDRELACRLAAGRTARGPSPSGATCGASTNASRCATWDDRKRSGISSLDRLGRPARRAGSRTAARSAALHEHDAPVASTTTIASGAASRSWRTISSLCWRSLKADDRSRSSSLLSWTFGQPHAEDRARLAILDPDAAAVGLDGELAEREAEAAPGPRRLAIADSRPGRSARRSSRAARAGCRARVGDADLDGRRLSGATRCRTDVPSGAWRIALSRRFSSTRRSRSGSALIELVHCDVATSARTCVLRARAR